MRKFHQIKKKKKKESSDTVIQKQNSLASMESCCNDFYQSRERIGSSRRIPFGTSSAISTNQPKMYPDELFPKGITTTTSR